MVLILLSNILLQNWGAESWHPGPSSNPVSLCRRGELGWLPLLTWFLSLPDKPGYILHFLLIFKERDLVCPHIYLTCWFYFWVSFGNLVLFFFSHATSFFLGRCGLLNYCFRSGYGKLIFFLFILPYNYAKPDSTS